MNGCVGARRILRWRVATCLLIVGLGGMLALRPTPAAQAQGPLPGPARLVQATPPDGAILGTAPARIDMVFDKDLADQSRIHLFDASDVRVDRDDNQIESKRMTIGVRDLPPGRYQLQWLAINDFDLSQARGGYYFVGVRFEAPLDPESTRTLRLCRAGRP